MKKTILKYCSFQGNASISEYRRMVFIFFLSVIIAPFVVSFFSRMIGAMLLLIMPFILAIPFAATTTRRLHDLGLVYSENIGMRIGVKLLFEPSKNKENK